MARTANPDSSFAGRHYQKADAEVYSVGPDVGGDDPTIAGRQHDNYDPSGPKTEQSPGWDATNIPMRPNYMDPNEYHAEVPIPYNRGDFSDSVTALDVVGGEPRRGRESYDFDWPSELIQEAQPVADAKPAAQMDSRNYLDHIARLEGRDQSVKIAKG